MTSFLVELLLVRSPCAEELLAKELVLAGTLREEENEVWRTRDKDSRILVWLPSRPNFSLKSVQLSDSGWCLDDLLENMVKEGVGGCSCGKIVAAFV